MYLAGNIFGLLLEVTREVPRHCKLNNAPDYKCSSRSDGKINRICESKRQNCDTKRSVWALLQQYEKTKGRKEDLQEHVKRLGDSSVKEAEVLLVNVIDPLTGANLYNLIREQDGGKEDHVQAYEYISRVVDSLCKRNSHRPYSQPGQINCKNES